MAVTSYGVNDALAVKLWARELNREVRKGLSIAPLIGKGPNAVIQEKTEFKSGGDKVTVGLRMQLTGDGVSENEVLEGNEESLTTYSDSFVINELDHAVRVKGKDTIDQQRVNHDLRDEARDALGDWYMDRLSLWFFLQMSGYTASTITYRGRTVTIAGVHRGNNPVTAPSTNRKIYATGSADETVNADSTAVMQLQYLDWAKERAMTANPKVRPIRINGENKYVVYLHPYQVTDLRTNTSTGQWLDIQKAAMTGGMVSNNPIYSGALGEYNSIIIRQSEDVVTGVHSSTAAEQTSTRRALFLGAQSGFIGFSSKYSKNSPYKWVEKTFDYDRELGVSAQGLMGCKKAIFNSEDFGVITISTYAASHG